MPSSHDAANTALVRIGQPVDMQELARLTGAQRVMRRRAGQDEWLVVLCYGSEQRTYDELQEAITLTEMALGSQTPIFLPLLDDEDRTNGKIMLRPSFEPGFRFDDVWGSDAQQQQPRSDHPDAADNSRGDAIIPPPRHPAAGGAGTASSTPPQPAADPATTVPSCASSTALADGGNATTAADKGKGQQQQPTAMLIPGFRRLSNQLRVDFAINVHGAEGKRRREPTRSIYEEEAAASVERRKRARKAHHPAPSAAFRRKRTANATAPTMMRITAASKRKMTRAPSAARPNLPWSPEPSFSQDEENEEEEASPQISEIDEGEIRPAASEETPLPAQLLLSHPPDAAGAAVSRAATDASTRTLATMMQAAASLAQLGVAREGDGMSGKEGGVDGGKIRNATRHHDPRTMRRQPRHKGGYSGQPKTGKTKKDDRGSSMTQPPSIAEKTIETISNAHASTIAAKDEIIKSITATLVAKEQLIRTQATLISMLQQCSSTQKAGRKIAE